MVQIIHHIDNRHNNGHIFKPFGSKPDEADLSDFTTHVVVNDDKDNPLIKELEKRLYKARTS